jgi:toxin ParE1/3/4
LSAKRGRYALSVRAVDDLEDIWRYSAETWSVEQADTYIDELTRTFDLIASMPGIGRERREFSPVVRIHAHAAHLIIYTLREKDVLVLRVLGGRQNWQSILARLDD